MTTQDVHAKEATARAKFNTANRTPGTIVTDSKQVIEVVKSSALIADPTLGQAVTQWEAATIAVDQREHDIKTTILSIAGLRARRAKAFNVWKRATSTVLAAVDNVSAGSAQVITQLGFAVATRQVPPPSNAAPLGLHVRYTKSLALVVKWKAVKESRAYHLEISDAAGHPVGAPVICVKSTCEPPGLVPGQKLTLRVAAQRKEGLSGWSDAVSIVVR